MAFQVVSSLLSEHHRELIHMVQSELAATLSASDRASLLVRDTFLIDGAELQQNRRQIQIETELLEALGPLPGERRLPSADRASGPISIHRRSPAHP